MKVKDIIKFTEWMPNPKDSGATPRFSILMPVYRRFASGHLTRAIQSILDQTYEEFELIVIDDGSVDGSFGEVQRFMGLDSRVHCLHHPRNVGLPAIGCYEAFLKSRSDYLMFCFDDSEYQKSALKNVAQYVSERKPQIAFGYIDYEFEGPRGDIQRGFLAKDKTSQAYLKMTNRLPNLGAILHRDVLDKIGFLDPHLAVARLTDWDYWKRAARSYELHYSDIQIGTEFGLVTGNSLGLTYPLDPWMAYEWTERERNAALIPGQFEEYDVQTIPDDLSEQGKLALLDLSNFYKNKFWYQPSASSTFTTSEANSETLDPNTRILVLSPAQDASVTLAFEYIPGAEKNTRFVIPRYFDRRELIGASALIVCRHLFKPEIDYWVKLAQKLSVPLYYYLDDNFMILSQEIAELAPYTIENVKKALASFRGVLVTSQALAHYFSENQIHPNIHMFPPVAPASDWLDDSLIPQKPEGVTRIGFMGGPHRYQEFSEAVLPAILRLAKDRPIELVIGGNFKLDDDLESRIKVYQFPFDISYRLALGRMQSADIDVLVHAGSETRNNPYKTHNVLLNARALRAFPVIANQSPYENIEDLKLGLVCHSNEEWYEKLGRAISEAELAIQVQEHLDRYVRENFSGEQNLDVLKLISRECPPSGVSVIDGRYRRYIDILTSDVREQVTWDPNIDNSSSRLEAMVRRNRSWLLPANSPQERFAQFVFRSITAIRARGTAAATGWNPLMAQGMVRLMRRLDYRLRPEAQGWNGLEFMIGTHGKQATGQLDVEIADGATGTLVRHQKLELGKIDDNEIVRMNFDPIPDSKDKDFRIRFLLQAERATTSISLYERNKTESKAQRVLRRFGLITRGNTLACRLWYENK